MKRVYIAVVLLLLIIAGSVWTIILEVNASRDLINLLDRTEESYLAGNKEETSRLTEELTATYQNRMAVFSFFLSHSDLTEIEKCITSLPETLNYPEEPDFIAELAKCRLLITKMGEGEIPDLKNIL